MSENGAVATLAARKRGKKLRDASAEIDGQTENRAELDDDGVHLPVAAGQRDMEQGFGDAQVRGGADGQEFRETFDDSQDDGQQIVIQASSSDLVMCQASRPFG